jgi:hypothetical protein
MKYEEDVPYLMSADSLISSRSVSPAECPFCLLDIVAFLDSVTVYSR